MTQKVQDQSKQVSEMAMHWGIVEALLGGTAGMRAAGNTYLPKEPREDAEDWEYRKDTATLFPAFERTLTVMASKPFSKQIVLSDETPPVIVDWLENCDLQGNNLHAFASQVLREAMGYGLCGILVDHPKAAADVKTVAQERAANARPYLVHIKHAQILGWRAELSALGVMTLTQLRLAECKVEQDGEFGQREVECVRVYEPGNYRLYQKNDKNEYTLTETGTTTLKAIPFVPFYGRKLGFMVGRTPLLDLAHLNVKHWQHNSDQDDSARFARKRLLVLTGVEDDGDIIAASSFAIKLPTGATATVVQGSAESVTVGRTELQALEQHMIQTGAELMVNRMQIMRTATESMNEAEANKSDLQSIVEQFEDGLDSTLKFIADWANLPEGGDANLFKDFGAGSLSEASAQLILSMQQGGLITKETAIKEQQRRGLLAANIDPIDELAGVDAQGPDLGVSDPLGLGASDGQGTPPVGDPAPGGATPPAATPQASLDIAPLTDAILALVGRMDAQMTQEANEPDPVAAAPMDLAALVAAINARPDPVVNMEAVIDATPIAEAVAKAIAGIPRPEAPIINMPAITVEQPSIVINNPPAAPINVAAPAITIEAPAPTKRAVMTKQADGSYVMQVTTNPSE